MLARICERLTGADVDTVTSAIGLDSRIGQKYLKGAIGYGGPCFPRDNVALSYLARQLGVTATLAEATDQANCQEVSHLAKVVKSKLSLQGVVGLLGVAYKPNTDVIEESQGLLLAEVLLAQNIPVVVYDPAAIKNAKKVLNGPVTFASSMQECVKKANVLVITTPWEEFRHISPKMLLAGNIPRVIVDCWRILDRERFEAVAEIIPLGIGTREGILVPKYSENKEAKTYESKLAES
jgi:UDPglucose 6-dehydrogenase